MKQNHTQFEDGKESEIVCPNCQDSPKLIVRTNRSNGNQFLGCPNWPECNFTRGIPEEWIMRAQGQQELFSFGGARQVQDEIQTGQQDALSSSQVSG